MEAIDFPENLDWVNTSKPLKLQNLKRKIVLLHFWKYSSINCIHTINDLQKLKNNWKNEIIIIGIHSPKFSSEKNFNNVKQAVRRNGIDYPVINDPNFILWQNYQIQSWPSIVLLDPRGFIFGTHVGEGVYENLNPILEKMIEEANQYNLLSKKNLEFTKIEDKRKTSLFFPGKIILNETGTELFVSDSNQNRILRIDIKSKKILNSIGSGEIGFKDGTFATAKFHNPQGIFLKNDILYIADFQNHSIREASLKAQTVKTLAGNGKQSTTFNLSGKGQNISLNSPWDLVEFQNVLYITMRGSHQIWKLNLITKEAEVYAGSGSENLMDDNLEESSFAQPTGITKDRTKFYITDSETSSIRSIEFKSKELVKTIIGKGLFEFGDIDFSYPQARLTFPMGITYYEGKLYVADTYNNKIKIIDPIEKNSNTLAGSGKIGFQNGSLEQSSFFEPTSTAVFKNKIYVSDTNNHLIRIIDLDNKSVSNFEFE